MNDRGRFGELKRALDAWSVTVASGGFALVSGFCIVLLFLALVPLLVAAWVYGKLSK